MKQALTWLLCLLIACTVPAIGKDVVAPLGTTPGTLLTAATSTTTGTPMDVGGISSIIITVSGTFSGTIKINGSTAATGMTEPTLLNVVNLATLSGPTTSITAAGNYVVLVGGLSQICAQVTAYTSGSITVTCRGSVGSSTFSSLFASGGGGTPGGCTTDVQVNVCGAFGGSGGLTFTAGTGVLHATKLNLSNPASGDVLVAGTTVGGVAPGTCGNVLTSCAGAWTSKAISGGIQACGTIVNGGISFGKGCGKLATGCCLIWSATNHTLSLIGDRGHPVISMAGCSGSVVFSPAFCGACCSIHGINSLSRFIQNSNAMGIVVETPSNGTGSAMIRLNCMANGSAHRSVISLFSPNGNAGHGEVCIEAGNQNCAPADMTRWNLAGGTNVSLVNRFGSFTQGAGLALSSINTQVANYQVTVDDLTVLGCAGAGAITLTLPPASGRKGQILNFKQISSTCVTKTVTVAAGACDTIEGASTVVLATQYATLLAQSDGVHTWYKLINGVVWWEDMLKRFAQSDNPGRWTSGTGKL